MNTVVVAMASASMVRATMWIMIVAMVTTVVMNRVMVTVMMADVLMVESLSGVCCALRASEMPSLPSSPMLPSLLRPSEWWSELWSSGSPWLS